ncbi:MAG: hypothetical protein HFG72_11740 [Hungatella sp.]|jgi:hypothetical protein|nr:hypothetical protein [Hungatella sp.]
MDPNDRPQIDWEMTEEYYQDQPDRPEFRLEDFMDEEEPGTDHVGNVSRKQAQRFRKITGDVHRVLALGKDGKTVGEIASELGLEPQYVYDIQVSAQGFREDDEIAVAHLVEMSL